MTASDLARAIQIAVSGFDDLRFKISFLDDLQRVVRLIVGGAVMAAPPKSNKKSKASIPVKSRKRK
jgi:hypothetical protein